MQKLSDNVYLKTIVWLTSIVFFLFFTTKFLFSTSESKRAEKNKTASSQTFIFTKGTFSDFKNKSFDISKSQAKVYILNFWASWCSPCVTEVPSLVKLIKHFDGKIELMAVSGDSSIEDIKAFLKSFPDLDGQYSHVIFDQEHSLMDKYSVFKLPESYVISSEGKLLKKISGSIDWYSNDSIEYFNSQTK